MWHCNCLRCQAVRGDYLHLDVDIRGNGRSPKFKPGPCQLCPYHERRPDHWGFVSEKRFIPEEITEFLGMTHICKDCVSLINHYLQGKLYICWAEAHPDVIKLAICMMLNSALRSDAHHDIWQKQVITGSLKKGYTMPEWAPPPAHKKWRELYGSGTTN